jgi:hypothetical protein
MTQLIDHSPAKVVIQHGLLDMVLIANGSALGIQNITFGGKQGFQQKPTRELIVDGKKSGLVHTERGLTFYLAKGSGREWQAIGHWKVFILMPHLCRHDSSRPTSRGVQDAAILFGPDYRG